MGSSGDYQPFSYRAGAGRSLTGFDVVIARRLAKDLGRSVRFVPFRWSELSRQLERGTFDIAMSGVTIRADRAARVIFTRPYVITGAVAVIRADDKSRFQRLQDLDRKAIRIAVNSGGHLERLARARFRRAQLLPVARNASLPVLLRQGSVDAVISEQLEAQTWRFGPFVLLGPFSRDRKAYALPPHATALLRQVNTWLAAREADGWLNQQRRRWLGGKTTWTPRQAGFEALATAMSLRLQLMPAVVAAKRRAHLRVEDTAQEARVLDHARREAAAAGLDPDEVVALFRTQITIAKRVERAAAMQQGNTSPQGGGTLTALRGAIATVSSEVIAELLRCQPWLHDSRWRGELDRTFRHGISAPGIRPSDITALIQAVRRVHGHTVAAQRTCLSEATCGASASRARRSLRFEAAGCPGY